LSINVELARILFCQVEPFVDSFVESLLCGKLQGIQISQERKVVANRIAFPSPLNAHPVNGIPFFIGIGRKTP